MPEHPEVVTVGAATVDRTYEVTNLPARDGGAFAREVTEGFGGVGANVALGCARLGRRAGLVARLGEDDMAERIAANLADLPVDSSRVRSAPGTSTHSLVIREPSGERMILTAGDSTTELRLSSADVSYLERADAVFFTAYVPDAVSRTLLDRAGDLPRLCFDLSGPVAELRDRGTEPETIDALLEVVDCFVAGEVAVESYLDGPAGEAPETLRARGVDRGAVTYGEAGASLFDGERTVEVPAFDVDVADTTGAGDAFNAGLLDRWVLGDDDPAAAGRFAAAVAALNCREEGARGGLPTRRAVESFLAERE